MDLGVAGALDYQALGFSLFIVIILKAQSCG